LHRLTAALRVGRTDGFFRRAAALRSPNSRAPMVLAQRIWAPLSDQTHAGNLLVA
jgi:hypothetical protein